jgi:glycosyltransferase involved in cell wall biosynthesis
VSTGTLTTCGIARVTRYAYIKNGDAVDQVRRVLNCEAIDRSGPDAFIGDFLRSHCNDELLVLCRWRDWDSFSAPGVRAESIPVRQGGFMLLRRLWSAVRIAVVLLRWRPDRILCGCTGELLWVAAVVSTLKGVPMVHSRHNEVQSRARRGWIVPWLDRASLRSCVGIACHGPFLAHQLRELPLPADKIFEFEVDLAEFADPTRTRPPPEAVRLLRERCDLMLMFVGRMQKDKGIFDLLEAFRALRTRSRIRMGLVYVGAGKDFVELNASVERSGCHSTVLLLGNIPHTQLPSLLRSTDIVVAPTRPEFPEGRCMVVLESLVLGTPVIAPNSGPFPFAVRHGFNGLLFEPGSLASLEEQLARICATPAELDRLRQGAATNREELLKAQRSFARAVGQAFSIIDGPIAI